MTTSVSSLIGADQLQMLSEMSRMKTTQAIAPAIGHDSASAGGFMDSFKQAVRDVDSQQREASDRMVAVDSGRSDDLVGAMMMSQEASLSFSALLQVRNKVMGAMDDLIKMPL